MKLFLTSVALVAASVGAQSQALTVECVYSGNDFTLARNGIAPAPYFEDYVCAGVQSDTSDAPGLESKTVTPGKNVADFGVGVAGVSSDYTAFPHMRVKVDKNEKIVDYRMRAMTARQNRGGAISRGNPPSFLEEFTPYGAYRSEGKGANWRRKGPKDKMETPTPIPIPASGLMIALALGGLGLFRIGSRKRA